MVAISDSTIMDNHLLYQSVFCPMPDVMHILNSSYDLLQEILQSSPETAGNPEKTGCNIYQYLEEILYTKVLVAICAVGLVGNILNLLVLTRKSLQTSMGRMEKFAHAGLISLGLVDMLFCLAIIPYGFVSKHQIGYTEITFSTIYNLYSFAIINTLILSSTVLTVSMAAGRYFAIVYPIKARQFIGMTCAKRSSLFVLLACIAFNIPRFWYYELLTVQCPGGSIVYVRQDGAYKKFELAYLCAYLVLGIVIPLLVLAYCNTVLLRTLRQSSKRIVRFRRNEVEHETRNRITLTLVIIVIFYLILVTPAELVTLCKQLLRFISRDLSSDQFNLAVAVVNVLQAVNFSFNFVLYCILNTHFRHVFRDVFQCKWSSLCGGTDDAFDSSQGETILASSMRSSGQASWRSNAQTSVKGYTSIRCQTSPKQNNQMAIRMHAQYGRQNTIEEKLSHDFIPHKHGVYVHEYNKITKDNKTIKITTKV